MSERTTRTGQAIDAAEPESAASNLFDLRILIDGLFVLYGIILIIAGIFANSAELHKASGININLWMGIGMFILGAIFLLWWRAAPLRVQPAPAPQQLQPEPPQLAERQARTSQDQVAADPVRKNARSARASGKKRRGGRS